MNQKEMKDFLIKYIEKRKDFKEALYELQARVSIDFKHSYRLRMKPESKEACIREFGQRIDAFRAKWNADPSNIENNYYIELEDLHAALRL